MQKMKHCMSSFIYENPKKGKSHRNRVERELLEAGKKEVHVG